MFKDEIVDEVRKARDNYAAKFDYDLQRIFKDIQERQFKSGHKVIRASRKSKRAQTKSPH